MIPRPPNARPITSDSTQEYIMPTVGKKKFPYTAKGKKQAKAYAKKTGKKTKKKGY